MLLSRTSLYKTGLFMEMAFLKGAVCQAYALGKRQLVQSCLTQIMLQKRA